METVKNKFSDINTQIVICTKVEDIPSLRLFCNLTPKEYITDTFEGLRIMLEKGQLYIGLEEGYIESYDHKMDKYELINGYPNPFALLSTAGSSPFGI